MNLFVRFIYLLMLSNILMPKSYSLENSFYTNNLTMQEREYFKYILKQTKRFPPKQWLDMFKIYSKRNDDQKKIFDRFWINREQEPFMLNEYSSRINFIEQHLTRGIDLVLLLFAVCDSQIAQIIIESELEFNLQDAIHLSSQYANHRVSVLLIELKKQLQEKHTQEN